MYVVVYRWGKLAVVPRVGIRVWSALVDLCFAPRRKGKIAFSSYNSFSILQVQCVQDTSRMEVGE